MSKTEQCRLEDLNYDKFSEYIEDAFHCASPAQAIFVLCEVKLLSKEEDPRVMRHPFSLLFRASSESTAATQGMFYLYHEGLGNFSVFMVPVEQDSDSLYFEATFT